ncbi:MAG TPA: helix-turn-helix domain-containing protein [Thermoanaerobaculia bacterium]|nr:helix-turn-helix domain-containing protein [Thermoanaerobaculia bacterium]
MPETLTAGDILTIRQLAEYLMVSEKTVYRMLDRNQVPGVRVGAQWRFRKQDIDAWLTEQVRGVEHDGKRGVLDAFEDAELTIHPLLAAENVWLSLELRSRDELLAFMIHEAALDPHVDRGQLLRSVLEREALCSTALVENAAFPHPLDPRPFRFSRKRVLLAVLREPIDYLDPHGHRPRVVAMILARSMQGHLLALSRAIKLFGDANLASRLASALDAEAAIALIRDAESQL